MPSRLKRYQQTLQLHYITFTCYHREQYLALARSRDTFEETLERVRRWYGFCVVGYVVMPEHVHMLVSEPERASLAVALQMLKQITSRKLRDRAGDQPFWQRRYYDFNVFSGRKHGEKLRYMHPTPTTQQQVVGDPDRNPVKRGLVANPEDWKWSSYRHYLTGTEGVVEIESHWTASKREKMGILPKLKRRT